MGLASSGGLCSRNANVALDFEVAGPEASDTHDGHVAWMLDCCSCQKLAGLLGCQKRTTQCRNSAFQSVNFCGMVVLACACCMRVRASEPFQEKAALAKGVDDDLRPLGQRKPGMQSVSLSDKSILSPVGLWLCGFVAHFGVPIGKGHGINRGLGRNRSPQNITKDVLSGIP